MEMTEALSTPPGNGLGLMHGKQGALKSLTSSHQATSFVTPVTLHGLIDERRALPNNFSASPEEGH